MNKWWFILYEFILSISIIILSWAAVRYGIESTNLFGSILSNITTFSLVILFATPCVSFLYNIRKLTQLGVDFDQSINQTGALELILEIDVPKNEAIKLLQKRQAQYSIEETNNETSFLVQDANHSKNKIRLSFRAIESNKCELTIFIESEDAISLNPLKSKNWKTFADTLFHFHRLAKDYEVDYIKSAVRKLKNEIASEQNLSPLPTTK